MPQGLALTIGLNSVDPAHYGGWSGELRACEADAEDMAEIAKSRHFTVKTLLTASATRSKVISEMNQAATTLQSGDIFVLSYSGHGGQVPDLNGDEIDDRDDETWCLYDGQFIDDETYNLLGKFATGVRILVFSDSCHSGTVTKQAYYQGTIAARSATPATTDVKYRHMPNPIILRTYRQNKAFYDSILENKTLKESREAVRASVLLISGCQDNQLSADGNFNGLFTGNLLRVWNNGQFKGDYRRFHKAIKRNMPPDQTPNYFRVGAIDQNFEKQPPFTV
ncbi:peptidase C14 caspase catalytic subunit p20 [Oscillatoria nigro-viridis PCC 7112]|uniref:Peptidase C14 caspase catalytic subunit p20 n=1 Tax=Phormidium nigroviride PCC 7112 TaxID=179408 RepID=K9VPH7_9CYAN|nr:caspase family protein [Oscillatoria nigro-viridis]AFZ09846.1 peptidase C14 caspase catalytic subunit p20 [Oscillatoria nigro-viridis PCC 7112]